MSTVTDRWTIKAKKLAQQLAYARRVLLRHAHDAAHPSPPPTGWVPRRGLDYAWAKPTELQLQAQNIKFVARYLSGDPGKNLTRNEAVTHSKRGRSIIVVWETTAQRSLGGRAAGAADAKIAAAQARLCGQPLGKPIYFAVDFDETPAQALLVADYFKGVNDTIGLKRTGVYGGYWVVKRLFDAKLVTYGWQTYAWSGGQWDKRAQVRQVLNGKAYDHDLAMVPDYGQWRVA